MSVDADVWTCPDCHESVRGPIEARIRAQLDHGDAHRKDRRVTAARAAQEAEERIAEREERRQARHARKAQARARTRGQ